MDPTTTVYGAGLDPWPYILACYAIGAVLIFGFAAWTIRDRARLRALAAAMGDGTTNTSKS
jgi:hypothetical protein